MYFYRNGNETYMNKINESVLRHIEEDSWSENDIYKMLGKACEDISYDLFSENVSGRLLCEPVFERKAPKRKPKYYYQLQGFTFWKKIEPEIYHFICYDKKPREWMNELISGDIRNLAVGIISALTAKYDIAMGIAVPIAALIIKKQIIRFCGIDIPYEKGHESNIKELLGKKDEDV